MTAKTTDDAIRQAALGALRSSVYAEVCPHLDDGQDPYDACLDCGTTAVVAAVRPLIESQLRERLAAAIEERAAEGLDPGHLEYMAAARIVRERP